MKHHIKLPPRPPGKIPWVVAVGGQHPPTDPPSDPLFETGWMAMLHELRDILQDAWTALMERILNGARSAAPQNQK